LAKLKPFAAHSTVGGLLSLMESLMSQYIVAAAAPARAITGKLLDEGTLSLVATSTTAIELSQGDGIYTLAFPSVSEGSYRLLIVDNVTGYGIASYKAAFTGSANEVVQASEYTAGGDATAANQTAIIAAISPITTVYNSQPASDVLSLVRGDAYDNQANNKLTWQASKDVSGEQVNFTVRDSLDQIVFDQDTDGVVTSAVGSLVEVSLSTSVTGTLSPSEPIYRFDVEIEYSQDSRWTLVRGTVCVEGDESR